MCFVPDYFIKQGRVWSKWQQTKTAAGKTATRQQGGEPKWQQSVIRWKNVLMVGLWCQ